MYAPAVPLPPASRRSGSAGFSLVEVSMAIGIIAFAFVALLGLLPQGLATFRSSIDTQNETWILQDINSMLQVTDWEKVGDLQASVFYYDEEGRMTDFSSKSNEPSTDPSVVGRRLYAVKLLIDKYPRPAGDSADLPMTGVYRVMVVFAPYLHKKAMNELDGITSIKDASDIKKSSEIHVRTLLVARMTSLKGGDPGIGGSGI